MAYQGFSGSGTVGNFASTTILQNMYPADRYAGRRATVETNGIVYPYFSTGGAWIPELMFTQYAHLIPTASASANAAALQAAHDALPSGGGSIVMSAGTFPMSTGIVSFTKPVHLCGQGRPGWMGDVGATILTTTDGTGDLITALSDGCSFRDFGVINTHASPSAGAGFKFGSTSVSANGFDCFRVSARGFYDNFYILYGAEWTMSKCLAYAHVNSGIHIRNYLKSDAGDSCISDCLIASDIRTANYGIFWESGSGLKFINNKVNWHENGGTKFKHTKAFFVRPAVPGSSPPASTSGETNGLNSLLLIENNSFENFVTHGFHFDQTAGATSSFANIILQGNEFQPEFTDAARAVVFDGPGSNRPSALTVSGNIFSNCKPMQIANVDTLYIGVNTCKANNAGSALIELGSNCFRTKIESQSILWSSGSNLYTRQIFQDATASGTNSSPKSLRQWKESRELASVSTSDTNLYRLITTANNAARVTLHVNGKDNAGNTIAAMQQRLVTATSGNVVTATTVNTDAAVNGANFTVTWDVSTTGELTLKIKAAGAATSITTGLVILEIEGEIYSMNYGYAYNA